MTKHLDPAAPRQSRRLHIGALAAAGLGLSLLWSASAQGATAYAAPTSARSALPAPATMLPRFSPIYMASHLAMTSAQAVAIAQEYDVLAAQSKVFTPYLTAMRAANPSLRIVAYMNGMFDQSVKGDAYPAALYSTTAAGRRITSSFGNWLMIPSTTGWQQAVSQRCTATIASSGYDGCFLDTMGTAPLGSGYDSGLPINPATGAVWDGPSWLAATSSVGAAAQAANPNALIVLNGISSGGKYYSKSGATSALLNPSGVAMAEICLRIPTSSPTSYPSLVKWQEDVDMLAQSGAQGQSVLSVTKLWVSATPAQQASWHKFALGTFLLGAGGHSYFSFLQDRTNAAFTMDSAWDHVAIGTPSGGYTVSGNLYQRAFSNGVVAVNPTGTAATITFTGPHTNLDGIEVMSQTLAPDSADVFVNA